MTNILRRILDEADLEEADEKDWALVPHTDGPSILATSNRSAVWADLDDHAEDGTVQAADGGSWGIAVSRSYMAGLEVIDKLEGYPIYDESDFSERELEAEQEAWEDYGRDDFRRELLTYLNRRIYDPGKEWHGWKLHPTPDLSTANEVIDTANEVIDAIDDRVTALTDSQLDAIWWEIHKDGSGESVVWEEDYDGTSAVFRVGDVVWGYHGAPRSYPQAPPFRWSDNAWDGMVPIMGDDGKVIYQAGEPIDWEPILPIIPRCERCGVDCPDSPFQGWNSGSCPNPLCDVPDPSPTADPTLVALARVALTYNAEHSSVLADAVEQAGDYANALKLRGRVQGWDKDYPIHYQPSKQRQAIREAQKAVVRGEIPCLIAS